MAKVLVPFRLDPVKVAKVQAYANARGATRQSVLEAAVDSFLADVQGGVPDLPDPSASDVVVAVAEVSLPEEPEARDASLRARHVRLAREMGWTA